MATNKEIVQQINDAFSRASIDDFLNHCAGDIRWAIAGREPMTGKEAIIAFMGKMPDVPAMTFTINNVIGDDAMVACDGSMEMPKADGSIYKAAFCDVYRFQDGKVAEMTSYIVDLKQTDSPF